MEGTLNFELLVIFQNYWDICKYNQITHFSPHVWAV